MGVEEEPVSIAEGILDDETYDWAAVLEGMVRTGGVRRSSSTTRRSPTRTSERVPDGDRREPHRFGWARGAGVALRASGDADPGERVAATVHRRASPVIRERTRGGVAMRSFLGRDIAVSRTSSATSSSTSSTWPTSSRTHARRAALICSPTSRSSTAFYQPSTRTRLTTEAMHRLGGHVLGFSDAKMTRAGAFYQESIKDTVHMLEYYGDVIAMRHFQQGAPHEAAMGVGPDHQLRRRMGRAPDAGADRPVHVWTEKGTLDGLRILCVGDMRMRTMHSILYAASQFDVVADVVGPPDMSLPEFGRSSTSATSLQRGRVGRRRVTDADVIYMEPVVQADYAVGATSGAVSSRPRRPSTG